MYRRNGNEHELEMDGFTSKHLADQFSRLGVRVSSVVPRPHEGWVMRDGCSKQNVCVIGQNRFLSANMGLG